MRRVLPLAGAAGLLLSITLGACEGPAGPSGEAGEAGAPGSAASGPAGEAGIATVADGGLTTSCMSPCHGFNGIIEQWKTSTHYFGAIANTEEQASWTNPTAACGNCHATDGLPTRLAGQFYVPPGADAGPRNFALGEVNYAKTTGGVAEIGYGGHSGVAIIGCTTCHDALKNDPHVTGGNYTKGDFKLRVPTGPNDQAYLEKSPNVGTVEGMPAGKWGTSNTCVVCHKSRKDVTNYITASNSLSSTFWGPHEGPHSDVFTGKGGYHYAGKIYTNSTHQTTSGCGTCHMPKVAENSNYPDHSFFPRLSTCSGNGCHSAAALTAELNTSHGVFNAAMKDLQRVLNDKGYLTRGGDTPLAPLTDAQLADQQFALDQVRNPGAPVSADEAGALYNYLLLARGGALGAHNPFYSKQLIFDSYQAVKGPSDPATPSTIPARP